VLSWPAHAVPSFARQTGFECTTCHLSWPELTSVGRQFKLGGYTLTRESDAPRPWLPGASDEAAPRLPLAAMVQGSLTMTRHASGDGADFPRDGDVVLQQLSAFYAGRIAGPFGAFAQWTYDGVAHRGAIDNVDVRVAGRHAGGELEVSYGLTLNNNPTVSDVYNTTPTWSFPYASSSVAVAPNAATLIDGGLAQQVAGLGAYALWNRTLYAEIAAYRTADGALSIFRAGTDKSTDAALDGAAPYWRLALQHTWDAGTHSAMLGTYGLVARKYPDPSDRTTPSDRFRDVGVDAQYQFITDRHRVGVQANWIEEQQRLDGTFAAGDASNPQNTLRTFRGKVSYYYDLRYGATLQLFRTRGSGDGGLYATGDPVTGSAAASPDNSGAVLELDWLPRRDLRLAVQYTAWREFNGARSNYDGFGRNAADNNTLYFVVWWMI
jgi:hypothetical protein